MIAAQVGLTRWMKTLCLLGIGLSCSSTAPANADDSFSMTLSSVQSRVIFETYDDGNWEIHSSRADGSDVVNLTKTPDIHELYPRASTDGTKIAFVVDEGVVKEGDPVQSRNVYYMNADGSGRKLVAKNARQPCWKSDGTAIAYVKGRSEKFTYRDFATKGVFVYDLETGEHKQHPNAGLENLYGLCWTPDGKWFVATVHAGMGFKHAILAIEADGMKVVDLKIPGCRPDVSPDGRSIAWGASDYVLRVGTLDFSGPEPKVVKSRPILKSEQPTKIYHIDWSPDGRYVTFSRGPSKKRLGAAPETVGARAEGWNICVADPSKTDQWMAITSDGKCNKEPDWVVAEDK